MTKQEFEDIVRFKLLGKNEQLINDFIGYWTESDLKGKKMRFQDEKFFDVNRRFSTFEKNKKAWQKDPEPAKGITLGMK